MLSAKVFRIYRYISKFKDVLRIWCFYYVENNIKATIHNNLNIFPLNRAAL